MTYPLSSDVIAGQPTAADHYNNLRADALRLGQAAADSVNLAELVTRVEQNLTIEILGTDRLRVPCSTSAPVALVVDGYFILRSTNNVDLPSAGKPTGSADMWYLFAVRTSGSHVFTLQVNTSALESSGLRLIGSFYWNGTAIEAPSIRTSFADSIKSLLKLDTFVGCQARLGLSTNPFADTSGSTIYLIPYKGNLISLYTAEWGWNTYTLSSDFPSNCNLSNLNTAKCYDVIAYWSGTAVLLEYLAWTNLNTRATSLAYQDGVYVKSSDKTRLYLGSFVPYSATQVDDLPAERGLWNFFNRVPKTLEIIDSTASWTYNVPGTWRSPNGNDKTFRVVVGIAEDTHIFDAVMNMAGNTNLYGILGIGIDSNIANSASILIHGGGGTTRQTGRAQLRTVLAIGCHTIYWLETTNGSGTVTFYGGSFSGQGQGGMTGLFLC